VDMLNDERIGKGLEVGFLYIAIEDLYNKNLNHR
jgi:hypothetical protein